MGAFAAFKIILIGAWALALSVFERLRPAAARPPDSGSRALRSGALWAANTLLNPLLTAPIAALAAAVPLWSRPEAFSGPAALALDVLLLDLWIYIWHRANHEVRFLWRFHEVHHRDEFLDALSAVRFHPGEVLLSAVARAPLLILFDVPLAHVLVFDTLVLACALFHHSNLALPDRLEAALRSVIVTPSHHWVHHHARRADTDSNYGTVLTLWDRLFGSFSPTRRSQAMKIGVEGAQDLSLGGLVLLPFKRL